MDLVGRGMAIVEEVSHPLNGSSWIGTINTTTGYYKTRERRFNRGEILGMS